MGLVDTIKELCESSEVHTIQNLEKAVGLSNGSIGKWDRVSPKAENLQKIADYFGVTTDYLLGRDAVPELTAKDEKDISQKLDELLHTLQLEQGALMFDGEPIDDETKELLIASLENSTRMAKAMAKKKFTPKKYRK